MLPGVVTEVQSVIASGQLRPTDQLVLTAGPRVHWGDAAFVDTYFGVTEADGTMPAYYHPTDEALVTLDAIAEAAAEVNRSTENIGARRLHTVMERVLEEVSFQGPALRGTKVVVDRDYVRTRVGDLLADKDLGRYVL